MSAYLKTDLKGKVQNLPHFKSEALLPVFEAVANSIQAIEERGNLGEGRIVVRVLRDENPDFAFISSEDKAVIGFEIEDNGIGFDNVNFKSFQTAESTHKLSKGGKGVGRFFWLKAFDKVEIDSVYKSLKTRKRRLVEFSLDRGIRQREHKTTDLQQCTKVVLSGFKNDYQKRSSAYKTTPKIAQRILEHCLSYFITEVAPEIIIEDNASQERIVLRELFEGIKSNVSFETIHMATESFRVYHLKLYSTHAQMHNLVLCANNRDVKTINISKKLGSTAHFDDFGKKFIYSVYATGDYLDKNVSVSRTGFEIPDEADLPLKEVYPVAMNELESKIVESAKRFLSPYLEDLITRKAEVVARYVSTKNPTLRAVVQYCPEALDEIELNSSDEKIDEVLYKYKGRAEYSIKDRSAKLLKTQAESVADIRHEYERITEELEDFQKDQLAAYVVFRKMIIELFEKNLALNIEGKHSDEDIIHDIIFPRKTSTDVLGFGHHNMWLIDERLTFHEYAASDVPLNATTTSVSSERPDILVFAEIDEDKIARAVSVVELKKPQREQHAEDPVKQLYRYVREVRDKKVKLPNGRNLEVNDTTRFYCYAICDITKAIREFAENNDYAELKGELGYYFYNRKLNAHTEIIAYDKIVIDARKRNKAFFESLFCDVPLANCKR